MDRLNIKKSALVVDNDTATRKRVSVILKENNYCVIEGKNGVEAISKFIATRPSLIVTGMNMPLMNGCRAARIIRNMYCGIQCNIILFTSEPEEILLKKSTCESVNIVINKMDIKALREYISGISPAIGLDYS